MTKMASLFTCISIDWQKIKNIFYLLRSAGSSTPRQFKETSALRFSCLFHGRVLGLRDMFSPSAYLVYLYTGLMGCTSQLKGGPVRWMRISLPGIQLGNTKGACFIRLF